MLSVLVNLRDQALTSRPSYPGWGGEMSTNEEAGHQQPQRAPLRTLLSFMHISSSPPRNGHALRPPRAFPIIRCNSWVQGLPYEVLLLLCQYLDPRSLAAMQGASKHLRRACLSVSGEVWASHLKASTDLTAHSPATAYGDYVDSHLRRAEIELASFHATRQLSEVVYAYSSQRRGVLGLVVDLGYFENEQIARALSKKRSYALRTIVVQNEEVIHDFKRRLPRYTGSPLTFFPLNAAFDIMTTPYHELAPIDYPGLLGYAVHLIKLRKEDEYLRHSLYFTIFKSLMVFDTEAALESYRRETGTSPYACSLEYHNGEEEVSPRFSHGAPREYASLDPAVCQGQLDAHVRACLTSLATIRYGS